MKGNTNDVRYKLVLKQLDVLQQIIVRMAGNSNLLKGWCLTLIAALLAFLAAIEQPDVFVVLLAPIVIIHLLDAFFLYKERSFRNAYNVLFNSAWNDDIVSANIPNLMDIQESQTDFSENVIVSKLMHFRLWVKRSDSIDEHLKVLCDVLIMLAIRAFRYFMSFISVAILPFYFFLGVVVMTLWWFRIQF